MNRRPTSLSVRKKSRRISAKMRRWAMRVNPSAAFVLREAKSRQEGDEDTRPMIEFDFKGRTKLFSTVPPQSGK